jgi:membrane-bound metal-dependent hydrolase YbcI (DUF457 family)
MFIGHFGVGFAAKAVAPRMSLGTALFAAQFPDLLWPALLMMGIEHVHIDPGATAVVPLAFDHYPISHSLLAAAGWSALLGGAYAAMTRDRRAALAVTLLVLSHWFLDFLVHRPDLPMLPWSDAKFGLEAWSSLPLTLAVEVPLFIAGVVLYARTTRALDRTGTWALWSLVALLCVIYAGNMLGPPPPDVMAIAWVGQLQWLIVLWGWWMDRHRDWRGGLHASAARR